MKVSIMTRKLSSISSLVAWFGGLHWKLQSFFAITDCSMSSGFILVEYLKQIMVLHDNYSEQEIFFLPTYQTALSDCMMETCMIWPLGWEWGFKLQLKYWTFWIYR